ncbi:MAG: alpha/beta hydrolase [Archangium sp.]|nr:alpha/beta hydrolase [Archangium sp.]MDP3570845.1 alpha/beta hydrolase [Archangium sp.]
MKRLLKLLLISLSGCYLALCVILFVVQRKLIFPAPVELLEVSAGMVRIDVPQATFFLLKKVQGEGPVVVHFHGNGEQVAYLGWLADAWAAQGASFVAVEYPGYPGTEGSPSEEAIVNAGEAALQHLSGVLKIDRSRLVLEGQSVGTGVAVTLASRGWGTKLVLISPYTTLPDVAAEVFPWLPVRLLMRDRFDSASKAPGLKVPTLIVHGTRDEVVPFELGEALSKVIAGAKFVAVEGAHHNDVIEGVLPAIFDFVVAR